MVNNKNINVCVFCGGSKGHNPNYLKKAKKLGFCISKNKWNLVYGGGSQGLMGSLASGFDCSRAKIISVVPRALNIKKNLYENPSKKILVKNLLVRKEKMINLSNIIIVLPGGFGTLDELLDIMALNYLGINNKKIIILNINRYWDPLKKLIDNMKKNEFVDNVKKCHLYYFSTVDKTIKFIENNL